MTTPTESQTIIASKTPHVRTTWLVFEDTACGALDCNHDGECPTTTVPVCLACLRIAEAAAPGWSEHDFDIALVGWPCAAACAADAVDDCACTSPSNAPEPDKSKLKDLAYAALRDAGEGKTTAENLSRRIAEWQWRSLRGEDQ